MQPYDSIVSFPVVVADIIHGCCYRLRTNSRRPVYHEPLGRLCLLEGLWLVPLQIMSPIERSHPAWPQMFVCLGFGSGHVGVLVQIRAAPSLSLPPSLPLSLSLSLSVSLSLSLSLSLSRSLVAMDECHYVFSWKRYGCICAGKMTHIWTLDTMAFFWASYKQLTNQTTAKQGLATT